MTNCRPRHDTHHSVLCALLDAAVQDGGGAGVRPHQAGVGGGGEDALGRGRRRRRRQGGGGHVATRGPAREIVKRPLMGLYWSCTIVQIRLSPGLTKNVLPAFLRNKTNFTLMNIAQNDPSPPSNLTQPILTSAAGAYQEFLHRCCCCCWCRRGRCCCRPRCWRWRWW